MYRHTDATCANPECQGSSKTHPTGRGHLTFRDEPPILIMKIKYENETFVHPHLALPDTQPHVRTDPGSRSTYLICKTLSTFEDSNHLFRSDFLGGWDLVEPGLLSICLILLHAQVHGLENWKKILTVLLVSVACAMQSRPGGRYNAIVNAVPQVDYGIAVLQRGCKNGGRSGCRGCWIGSRECIVESRGVSHGKN